MRRGVWPIAREEGTPDYPHSVRRVGLARVHDAINQTYISVILKISRLTGSGDGALKELMTFRCPSSRFFSCLSAGRLLVL